MQILLLIATTSTPRKDQMDISYDGSVIVAKNPANHPIIWRDGLGTQVLDDCPLSSGGLYGIQCSEDGQRIDAWGSGGFFTWDALGGWRPLQQELEGLGARDFTVLNGLYARTRDGVAALAFLGDPAAPTDPAQPHVVFIGVPPPGALGSNYCGPAALNSSGYRALVQATGSASIQSNSLTMKAQFLPEQACGFVISSPEVTFTQALGGSVGNLCVGGGQSVGRHDQAGEVCVASGDGVIEFPIDLQSLPSPTAFYAAQPGETLNFQVWFRDTDPSGAPTSNFTDAVSITFE